MVKEREKEQRQENSEDATQGVTQPQFPFHPSSWNIFQIHGGYTDAKGHSLL